MGVLTDYLERKILDHFVGNSAYTIPGTYVGLFTTLPVSDASIGDAGTGGTEVASGFGYSRISVTNNATNWPDATEGGSSGSLKSNGTAINFGVATDSWGTVEGWGIWDGATGNNLLAYGPLVVEREVTAGAIVQFKAGNLRIRLFGKVTDAYGHAMLDYVFGGKAYTVTASLWAGFFSSLPDATGVGGTEISGNGYARKEITNDATNFPSATTATPTFKVLGVSHETATATGAGWPAPLAVGYFNALTGVDLLFWVLLQYYPLGGPALPTSPIAAGNSIAIGGGSPVATYAKILTLE